MAINGKFLKPQWFHILLCVADSSLHGSAIMDEVLQRTDGEIRLWPGALYGSLREMTDAGLVEEAPAPEGAPTDRGKRRFYGITAKGRQRLATEVQRIAGYVQAARAKNAAGDLGAV